MNYQGDARLEQLTTGDGQERGGAQHLRLVATLAALGMVVAYLFYGADHRRITQPNAEPAATSSALSAPLPAENADPVPVDVLLFREGVNGGGTLVRYAGRGVLASRLLNGFVAPLRPGVEVSPFPLAEGRSGLAVGVWGSAGSQAAVADDRLDADPVLLRAPGSGAFTFLGASPQGIWTTGGSPLAKNLAWSVQLRADASAEPYDVPEPPDLAALAEQGTGFSVLGLLRAPGTDDYGVLVGVPIPGGVGVELRAEWPDGRATKARTGALVALGPDYAVVADTNCPGARCALSVLRLTESGAVARQPILAPEGWSYTASAQDGRIAFASGGFVLPVTQTATGTAALAWVLERGGRATLVPGSAGLAQRAGGRVVAASGSTVVFATAARGGAILLAWWDTRTSASARVLGRPQPDADLLAALPR